MEALKALGICISMIWTFTFLLTLFNARPKFTKLFHIKFSTVISLVVAPCVWPWIMVELSDDKTPWVIIGILIPVLVFILSKSKLSNDIVKLFKIDDRDLNSPY
jgi:membrane protein insertase Oxa1/YidC/SpoIIIJ